MEREQLIGAAKSVENQDRPPFLIRAHHIVNFYHLLNDGKSASELAENNIESIKKEGKRLEDKEKQLYVVDVLGDTAEQIDKFRRFQIEFFGEFLRLPPDYPVKIAEDQKDRICEGCAIGEHCTKRDKNKMFSVSGDAICIFSFKELARKLNLEDDVKVISEIATYSDAKSRKVESILTTVQTFRRVMSDINFFGELNIAMSKFRVPTWKVGTHGLGHYKPERGLDWCYASEQFSLGGIANPHPRWISSH